MKRCKKLVVLAVMMLSMLALSANVSAASKAAEKKAVKKVLTSFCKAHRASKATTMNRYLSNTKEEYLFPTYLTSRPAEKKLKSLNKKMKYKISSINVKGKKATAKIKYTYYSAYDAAYDAAGYALFYFAGIKVVPSSSRYVLETERYFADTITQKPAKKKTKTVKVSLVKKGGSWKIKPSDSINDIYTADFFEGAEDCLEDIDDALSD